MGRIEGRESPAHRLRPAAREASLRQLAFACELGPQIQWVPTWIGRDSLIRAEDYKVRAFGAPALCGEFDPVRCLRNPAQAA
jgi:hypothetical protein